MHVSAVSRHELTTNAFNKSSAASYLILLLNIEKAKMTKKLIFQWKFKWCKPSVYTVLGWFEFFYNILWLGLSVCGHFLLIGLVRKWIHFELVLHELVKQLKTRQLAPLTQSVCVRLLAWFEIRFVCVCAVVLTLTSVRDRYWAWWRSMS